MARREPLLPPRSFTAAGAPFRATSITDVSNIQRLRQAWWHAAWKYYDEVPPIHYGGQFVANSLSKLRLVAAKFDPANPNSPIEVKEGPVAEAVRNLQSPKGGQRSVLRTLGLNLFVPGECWLIGYEDSSGHQVWEAVSNDELDITTAASGQLMRKTSPGSTPILLPSDTLSIRIWREHPRWSDLADSPMQSLIEQCETYLMLTRAERSIALSRVAGAGMLFVPQELIPPSQQDQMRNPEGQQSNKFWDDLVESMMIPIADKGDPMNVVPMLLTGPAEFGDKIKHITLDRSLDDNLVALKDDTIKQMATALDLPAEVLLGHAPAGSGDQTGGNNHFQAAMLKMSTFQDHIQPFAELVVDALTEGYLRPALKRAGIDDDGTYIWFDAANLILEPDLSEVATQARDRLDISPSAYLRYVGLKEEDRPTEEEYAKMVGLKLADPHMAVTGEVPPSAEESMKMQAQLQQPQGLSVGGRPTETTSPDTGARGAPKGKTSAPPQQPKERRVTASAGLDASGNLGYKLGQIDLALIDRTRVIADMAVHRTAEKVGAKLRSKVANEAVIRASIQGMDNERAAQHLAPITASLGFDERELIRSSLADVSREFSAAVMDSYASSHDLIEVYLGTRAMREGDPIWRSFAASIEQSVNQASALLPERLEQLVWKYVFGPKMDNEQSMKAVGEMDRLFVKPGDIRDIVVQAGGGSPDSMYARNGGVATGRVVQEYMAAKGVPTSSERIWLYGQAPRTEQFQGHLQLDGMVFDDWESVELSVWPEDAWIRSNHYHPGDHRGCACVTAPYVPNYGDPYQIEI